MGGKVNLRNERGVAIVVALLLLMVLTLIGISSINTTSFENVISGNERVGNAAFFASEGGLQAGYHQVPDTTLIPKTKIGKDASYAAEFEYKGLAHQEGFSDLGFKRYRVDAVGESLGGRKELEIQVRYGPITTTTQYNN